MTENASLRFVRDLSPIIGDGLLAHWSLNYDDSLWLVIDETGEPREENAHPGTVPLNPRVIRLSPDTTIQDVQIDLSPKQDGVVHAVQSLMDNSILFVHEFCTCDRRSSDLCAVIYNPDGVLRSSLCLYEDKNHVLVTPDSRIWVGYNDQYWYHGQGHFGLCCYDTEGKRIWQCHLSDEVVRSVFSEEMRRTFAASLNSIRQCIALNADGNAVWSICHPEWPILRVAESLQSTDAIKVWKNEFPKDKCPVHLLVADNTLGFFCNVGTNESSLVIRYLNDAFTEFTVSLSDSSSPSGWDVRARGSTLHTIWRNSWYSLDIANLPHGISDDD